MPIEHDHRAGSQSIAAEHERLSGLVSRIGSAIERENFSAARDMLLQLADLYVSHFRHEEQIMARVEYPALQAHRREHRDLIDSLESINLTLRLESSHGIGSGVAVHIEATLRHTIETDQRFLDFLAHA